MAKIRIDKWLWAVRIFKTRTIAADNCKKGNVKVNNDKAKPASMIALNDVIQVHKEGFNLDFKVIQLIEKRVGYPIAQGCYENVTPPEEMNKFKTWFVGKAQPEFREKGAGRPTKKERRIISDFKEQFLFDDDEIT